MTQKNAANKDTSGWLSPALGCGGAFITGGASAMGATSQNSGGQGACANPNRDRRNDVTRACT